MTRVLLLAACWVVATGCLDFKKLLDDCKSGDGGCSVASPDGGTDGGLARLDGGICHRVFDLCFEEPFRTSVDLNAVWGSAPDDVWIAGEGGMLLHWDGGVLESWWGVLPADHYAQFYGVSATEIYLVGPAIYAQQKFDGTRWSDDGPPISGGTVNAVDGTSPTNLTAAVDVEGTSGALIHRGPNGWQSAGQFPYPLVGVQQTADQCFASSSQDPRLDGGFGGVFLCDGGLSLSVDAGDVAGMFTIGSTVGVTGPLGTLYVVDGGWSTLAPSNAGTTAVTRCLSSAAAGLPLVCVGKAATVWPDFLNQPPVYPFGGSTAASLWGVWRAPGGTLWVSGDYGQLAQIPPGGGSPPPLSGGASTGRSVFGLGTDGTQLLAVGSGGALMTRSSSGWGSRDAFSGEETRALFLAADGTWLAAGQGGHVWVTANPTGAWALQAAGDSSEGIDGVWASDSAHAWATTSTGRVLQKSGGPWTEAAALPDAGIPSVELWKVTGDGAGLLWAAGSQGTVLSFDGAAWHANQLSTEDWAEFFGVWSPAPGEVWAVGNTNSFWHFTTAAGWTAWPIPPGSGSYTLYDVWGSSPADVYAVGENGGSPAVFHFDGAAWSDPLPDLHTLRNGKLESVRKVGGTVFFAGERGTIVRYQP